MSPLEEGPGNLSTAGAEVRREGREPLPDHAGESSLLSRSAEPGDPHAQRNAKPHGQLFAL